ncbi:PepSY-associated TM helix domain-containing protein [Adhaeribacter rhizoryzae]|uniref:PepSY domain-containing protein n=1 Tax=Adhaeribacter rhizoryzae TaxID=2607907 RepID=A0A5M6DIT2_9BACT|nr:PepSY-associated TM helix domain-containing protein [Adhaeribacter rhizoryzae]KAA5547474.1 PepSY domain-containing protein [Adhaeribacter rhizoryzae]
MRNPIGKKVYKIHKWCGLVAGLFIFVMGLTGAVLVFNHELEAWEHHKYWEVNNQAPVNIDKAYRTITSQYKNWEIRLQRFSDNPQETLIFSLRRPQERLMVFTHPANGQILATLDSHKTITTWLLTLHYSFHANLPGKIMVFITGLIFLISLVTGVITYRKVILKMLLFRVGFSTKTKRSFASSLHRFVGVWALLLNLLMVLTGAWISYGIMANGFIAASTPAKSAASPPIAISIDQALIKLKTQHPDFRPTYMRFPKAENQPLTINGFVSGQPFYYSQFYNAATFDAKTGAILNLKLNPAAETKTKLDSISHSIHFLEFGNWLIKLLFCFIGISAPLLSITGFLLWKWRIKNFKEGFKPQQSLRPGSRRLVSTK